MTPSGHRLLGQLPLPDQAPAIATIETVVPSGPPDFSTIAPSWWASAWTILVPRPLCGLSSLTCAKTMPLSDTDRRQPEARESYLTKISPAAPLGQACFSAVITSSVTIKPRLTASLEVAAPPVACTLSDSGRRSPIIDFAKLSQSLERYGPISMLSFNPEACSCCCTVATDMTRWWASCRCRRVSSEVTVRALSRRMLAIDLKAVGDAMLHLLQQNFFLSEQLVFFPLRISTLGYIF